MTDQVREGRENGPPPSSVFLAASVTQLPEEGEESAAQASHQQQVGQDEEAEIHNLEMIVIIVTIITVITSRLSRGDFPAALSMEANSFCLGFISIPDCGVEEAR